MARSRIFDKLQNYPFWIFDASGFAGNPLFSIFDPVFAFSASSAPEITTELKDVKAGNWEYKRRAVKGADVSPITLARGARFYDSDFYIWITNAIRGIQPLRRNIIIVQFLGIKLVTNVVQGQSTESPNIAAASLIQRIPARAWYCVGCIPTRYKAGGDFDATSSEVSIMELELQPEAIEEITVATVSPIITRSFSLGLAVAEEAGAGLL